jgi:hypothetical protein
MIAGSDLERDRLVAELEAVRGGGSHRSAYECLLVVPSASAQANSRH